MEANALHAFSLVLVIDLCVAGNTRLTTTVVSLSSLMPFMAMAATVLSLDHPRCLRT